jgi:uncharacterized protein (TIGR03437 family)
LAAQVPLNLTPQRAIGNVTLRQASVGPNLVEGREFNKPLAVAVDAARKIVWVADTSNNRVLGFQNASAFDNGARADFVLGQRDFLTTEAQGPGTGYSAGLFFPTGVAVDASGSVYVFDAGNNRVIRYPHPFDQTDQLPDMVIGQPDFRTRGANQGGLSEKTLQTNTNSAIYKASLAFDAQGNLWVVDAGNHRVLRFPASALGTDAASFPSSNLVIGQPDFVSNAFLPGAFTLETRIKKTGLREPSGIAFDQAGRLFITDNFNRVLVYSPPFANGMTAARIMGIAPSPAQGQPPLTPVNEYTVGITLANGTTVSADGVFTAGNIVFVVDTPASRILRFDSFDSWPAETQSFSPRAQAVIGQDGFTLTQLLPNRGQAEPSESTLLLSSGATFANGEVLVADTENNRVLAFGDLSTGPPASAGSPYAARRVLGQDSFAGRAVNLLEGREFAFNAQGVSVGNVKIDTRSNPPRLYVADSVNHRILGFADARKVRGGDKADIVIGQPDFSRAVVNYPTNDANVRGPGSLFLPSDIAIDKDGNLWVADSGNSRVLRFPDPFANPGAPANLVVGQSSFSSRLQDATARTMSVPFGLAFSVEGLLYVSDNALNRVLQFNPPFLNGMAATRAFGQPDLNSSASGNADNRLNAPRYISLDTDDRLYVADTNNNRVQIFSRAPLAGPEPRAAYSLTASLSRPIAVHVSPQTGEIWVGNTGTNVALRYPNFDRLVGSGDTPNYQVPVSGPLGLTTDQFSNLYMADLRNRVVIHYPRVNIVNGANYLPRIAPGVVATLLSNTLNYTFTDQTAVNQIVPMARSLADLRVVVNGEAAPMYFTSPFQINFQMPMQLPTSGAVELQVEQISTGRVLAATAVQMDVASPGLFTLSATGTGQLAAINVEDNNSINGVGEGLKPVGRGKIISIYGTGQGPVNGAPPDGVPPTGPVPTDVKPIVVINNRLDDKDILYSGLAPGLVGVWQLNLRVPETVPPGNRILVVISFRDIASNNPQNIQQIVTTIAVQ